MITYLRMRRKIRKEIRKSLPRQQEMVEKFGFKPASVTDYESYKRSDTLFILGSGESICQLTQDHWKKVSDSDSFGINHWMIHPHVPNFYSFETPRAEDSRVVLMNNLQVRASSYRDCAFIFKVGAKSRDMNSVRDIANIASLNDLSVSVPSYFTVRNKAQLICLLRKYKNIKNSIQKKKQDLFFRQRASVVFATMFAYDLGFKDIVFCGIDGYAGSGYFFEQSDASVISEDVIIPPSGQKKGGIHKTMDADVGSLTVDVCLRLINEHLFKRTGIRMWVGTSNSMLSEWMPSWDWENDSEK